MISQVLSRSLRVGVLRPISSTSRPRLCHRIGWTSYASVPQLQKASSQRSSIVSPYHTTSSRYAQGPTADALMENINDLYATAKDEFEIAAEETVKKTVYAQDDRDAAREALTVLKEAFERALSESDPDVSKEVRNRVGRKLQELENAVVAMEESAMED